MEFEQLRNTVVQAYGEYLAAQDYQEYLAVIAQGSSVAARIQYATSPNELVMAIETIANGRSVVEFPLVRQIFTLLILK